VRGRADEQAALERQEPHAFQLAWAEHRSRWRPPRDQYEALLNEHDAARLPLTRADLHSQLDEIAKRVVAAGGGTQAVIDANELNTLKQLVDMIEPAILTQRSPTTRFSCHNPRSRPSRDLDRAGSSPTRR
jgi:hypothetical protein